MAKTLALSPSAQLIIILFWIQNVAWGRHTSVNNQRIEANWQGMYVVYACSECVDFSNKALLSMVVHYKNNNFSKLVVCTRGAQRVTNTTPCYIATTCRFRDNKFRTKSRRLDHLFSEYFVPSTNAWEKERESASTLAHQSAKYMVCYSISMVGLLEQHRDNPTEIHLSLSLNHLSVLFLRPHSNLNLQWHLAKVSALLSTH
jgi:hypothetical protein